MAHVTEEYIHRLYQCYGELKVLDDIIRNRAADSPPRPILAYPRCENSIDDYEYFTGKQLDLFVDASAKQFISLGVKPYEKRTIALLAPSNVDFLVNLFALSRLGCTVLALSLRIKPTAVLNLLRQTNCETIAHGHTSQIYATIQSMPTGNLKWIPLPARASYDLKVPPSHQDTPLPYNLDRDQENTRPALIMHSSGSTGLPKPITISHRAILTHATSDMGMHNFATMPLYHAYGLSTTFQAMYMGKTAHMYNADLPVTAENLITAISATKPQMLCAVPFVLSLLADASDGMRCLRSCRRVIASGARTPDELGERLIAEGVNFSVVLGTTEAALLGCSTFRKPGDDSWDYIRIFGCHQKHVRMESLGNNQYEAVYLKGHSALSTSNSDHPFAGAWRSSDVFTPHPTIPDAWKHMTRLDDRVTLANGEKVLPLPIEGRIRQNPLVREAVVFGIGKSVPGLLVFKARTDHGIDLSDESFVDAIWPCVEAANRAAEAFSNIMRDMIVVLPPDVEYPRTDKTGIIRPRVYAEFNGQIEEAYDRLDGRENGGLVLDLPAMESYIMQTFSTALGIHLSDLNQDFFAAGVDSLKAIQVRHVLQKTLDLGGQILAMNAIYNAQNAKGLALQLFSLRKGVVDGCSKDFCASDDVLMKQFIAKYSTTRNWVPKQATMDSSDLGESTVILTGATGSIGAHVLARLVSNSRVCRVYCFTRCNAGSNPMTRVMDNLRDRGLQLSPSETAKIICLHTDLSREDFGLHHSDIQSMRVEVSLIIHVAWAVNFNISLQSYEQHIAGLRNLLCFSMSVVRREPALLLFCSSISVALNTHDMGRIVVSEGPVPENKFAATAGYAKSKWVSEQIILNAARMGARSCVLRLGQVSGDSKTGIWNSHEAIPCLLRSALSLKALPDTRKCCYWLPVNTIATVVMELSESLSRLPGSFLTHQERPHVFFNLVNPFSFQWSDVLDELRTCGVDFQTVSTKEWLQLLRASALCDDVDLQTNPAVKLLSYFEEEYGLNNRAEFFFETELGQKQSTALSSAPDIIQSGYMRKYLLYWLGQWKVVADYSK